METVSIILPARNEAVALIQLLPALKSMYSGTEIIVVDDGSSDETAQICRENYVQVIVHPYSMGNGAAIKSGARAAEGEILVFMDADGQHKPEDIPRLLDKLKGHDMVVGARDTESQAGAHRAVANGFYNWLASWITEQEIQDLTSGFRAVRTEKFRKFLYLLPNGFSYPTTITMCFFRAGYSVCYEQISAPKRIGTSHIKIFRDGFRFFLIIFKIGTLYSPLKLFMPISLSFFFTAVVYYLYTFITMHRFTNMSALLFVTAVLVFLIGLVSEQIAALNFKDSE